MNVDQYWMSRFLLYRGLFLTYFLGFLVALRQFPFLAGENGILPFTRVLEGTDAWQRPTLLRLFPTDQAVRFLSLGGLILSAVGFAGIEWLGPLAVGTTLLLNWVMYLSLVKAGGLFYGFGWESFLLEAGVLGAFMGGAGQRVPRVLLYLFGWLLFRVMFGAGMIKIRGDACWRDLTCMDYHYETQPMPNPVSWFAHHLPSWFHKLEVIGNHVAELVLPFLYFLPQPWAGIGGVGTILFQGWLMLTGNFSWLNFLTAVVALPLIPDFFYGYLPGVRTGMGPAPEPLPLAQQGLIVAYAIVVLVLSYRPAINLVSNQQIMNASFDPLNLVNTYGAFGSITKRRYELVVQGQDEEGEWHTYEFRGKPTDPRRRPPQWAPYHLRLDWQMWFAAFRRRPPHWILEFLGRLLDNDERLDKILHHNPFSGTPGPVRVRIQRYVYSFTRPQSLFEDGQWWERRFVEQYCPPVGERDPGRMRRKPRS